MLTQYGHPGILAVRTRFTEKLLVVSAINSGYHDHLNLAPNSASFLIKCKLLKIFIKCPVHAIFWPGVTHNVNATQSFSSFVKQRFSAYYTLWHSDGVKYLF